MASVTCSTRPDRPNPTWHVFRSSIKRFMIASLGILMSGLLIAVSILAARAWNNFSTAGRIARLADTDKTLFNALVSVRAQVPLDSTALLAENDPLPVIRHTYNEASQAVAVALGALRTTEIDGNVQLALAIQSTWYKVVELQAEVTQQAAMPLRQRSLHAIDGWREAIHQMMDSLGAASSALGNAVRIGDAQIAEYVQVRQFAWAIRDRYGLQCSMLRPSVAADEPLDPTLHDSWIANRAVYAAEWRSLDEFLGRPGASSDLLGLTVRAHDQTDRAQEAIDRIVGQLGSSHLPVIAGDRWTALCDGPFESILAIARQAQVEATRRAESLRATSSRILMIAGFGLTVVVAFGAFAVVVVQRRFARPMSLLTLTIARLSRGEYDEPAPSLGSPDELGSMAQALVALRGRSLEAERLQQAMSRFTADASHQMRTPLTILQTHISVLGELIPQSHAARSSLADISGAADRLQRLLIQLLKLAKAEGGVAAESDAGPIDLRTLVQEVAEEHLTQATQAGVGLHYEAASTPCLARLDPITLREILANLIDNGIRYNAPGGHVVVRLFVEDGARIIEVEDDGPGIPPAEHEKVFTRFYRLKRDQDRVGSGLGLAIVSSLVALMDASLHLASAVGDGSRGLRVRLALPERPPPSP